MRNPATRAQLIGETLAGFWVIALLTLTGYVLHFNAAPVGFLFLLVVVCEAILCGFWQASVVSVLACLSLDYFFYPPLFHLSVADLLRCREASTSRPLAVCLRSCRVA